MREVVVDIASGDDVLDSVLAGAKKLHDAVAVTMGPKGRNVLFKKLNHSPGVTHDGVTVAKLVASSDPREQVALEILRQAALKQDGVIGDGTTTVTVLAYALLSEAIDSIRAGMEPMKLRRMIDEQVKDVVTQLEKQVDKDVTLEKLTHVANVAAGEAAIGEEVAKVVFEAGYNTPVLLNFSDSEKTYSEVIKGIKIDGGPASPYLLSQATEEVTSPYIFVVDAKLRERDDVLPLLRLMAGYPENERSFMLVCSDIAGDALAYMVTNKQRGFANIAVSRVPAGINNVSDYLRDIAVACGAKLIAPHTDNNLRTPAPDAAGRADKAIINQLETIIVNGGGAEEDLEAYRAELKGALKAAKTKGERTYLEGRIKSLEQRIVAIYVGGQSESDAEERHYRYEDAVGAARAALRGGVLVGGGVTLASIDTGGDALKRALKAPFYTVMKNAGIEIDFERIDKPGYGVDVMHPEDGVIDLRKRGILDPAESEIESVKTAAAVAGLLLTSGAIIVDKEVGEDYEIEQ